MDDYCDYCFDFLYQAEIVIEIQCTIQNSSCTWDLWRLLKIFCIGHENMKREILMKIFKKNYCVDYKGFKVHSRGSQRDQHGRNYFKVMIISSCLYIMLPGFMTYTFTSVRYTSISIHSTQLSSSNLFLVRFSEEKSVM